MPSWRSSASTPAGTSSTPTPRSSTSSAWCAPTTCSGSAASPTCSSPGSRSPPRPRRSAPGAGSSSSPSTTRPARSTRRSSRTPRVPTPPRCSAPGCWWCAVSCAGPAIGGSPCAAPAPGTCSPCTACGSAPGSRPCTRCSPRCPRASPRSASRSGRWPGLPRAGPPGRSWPRPRRRATRTSRSTAGGMGRRRVLVHSSGFKLSPYADVKPAGDDVKQVARKLWHRSPGSPG